MPLKQLIRLLAELVLTLSLAAVFLIQAEAFGWWLCRGLKRLDKSARLDFAPRLILGMLLYAQVFFWVGAAGLLSRPLVLVLSFGVWLGALIYGKRWKGLAGAAYFIRDHRYAVMGAVIFAAVTGLLWYRPVLDFDALWYHITIPKIFLQHGNIAYNGDLLRYSMQPSMTYFWYLWPLSLPVSTVLAGMVINMIQLGVFGTALIYMSAEGIRRWGWRPVTAVVGPVLIGLMPAALLWYGAAYSDPVGLSVALVAGLYAYSVSQRQKVGFADWLVGLLLIAALATIKIFFTLFAVILATYYLAATCKRISFEGRKALMSAGILALLLYAPWVVRSLLETGRLLDPIGAPGIADDVYSYAGSGNARNHWTSFIFKRFVGSLPEVLFNQFTPLLAMGLTAPWLIRDRRQLGFWAMAVVGFWAVFFAAVVLEWRYLLPGAVLLAFMGICLLDRLIGRKKWLGGALLAAVAVACLFNANGTVKRFNLDRLMFAIQRQSSDQFVAARHSFIYDYPQRSAIQPGDLSRRETILVIGVHNLAYIENPLLEPSINPELARGDLIENLKAKGVRYILVKETVQPFESICTLAGINDCSKTNSVWEIIVHDPFQRSYWLRLR